MICDCPHCGATYPDVVTDGWSGGSRIVKTHNGCKKCGTRFTIVNDTQTQETTVEVHGLVIQSPDSAKKHQSFEENMKRLHAEIERFTYAAEIACGESPDCIGCDMWNDKINMDGCLVRVIRKHIGEHPEQHDCMQENPR